MSSVVQTSQGSCSRSTSTSGGTSSPGGAIGSVAPSSTGASSAPPSELPSSLPSLAIIDCASALQGAIFTNPAAIKPAAKKRLKAIIEKYVK